MVLGGDKKFEKRRIFHGTICEPEPGSLRELHVGNERLVSYNVEMTEVTGGTFWKAYTPAQIAGTEPVRPQGRLPRQRDRKHRPDAVL